MPRAALPTEKEGSLNKGNTWPHPDWLLHMTLWPHYAADCHGQSYLLFPSSHRMNSSSQMKYSCSVFRANFQPCFQKSCKAVKRLMKTILYLCAVQILLRLWILYANFDFDASNMFLKKVGKKAHTDWKSCAILKKKPPGGTRFRTN